MTESNDKILWEAEFSPKVKNYWLLTGVWILLITVFGILLIPFWIIGGPFVINRYLKRMRCALTDRSVILNKGLLIRREKTVPLDKITDVAMIQGPIMRSMELHAISFETAGQSTTGGATLSVTGIVNAREFRNAVLKQRDSEKLNEKLSSGGNALVGHDPASPIHADSQVLGEILEVLKRIESKMEG